MIFFVIVCAVLFAATESRSHPAHAKPVNYPFVVGFERFFTDLDTPEHLAKGGLVLLNELNCVACHKQPESLKDTLTGRTGTRLAGVADRFDDLDLEMMIRNPRFVKTDTIMPSMFSGPDRDLDEIDALKHFLATLKETLPKYGKGDLEKGKLLYHKSGCVSCHAPEIDYRPPWVPENIEVYLTALPSVPMNLADRYPREALIDLLLDPTKHRPSGRMPKFDLTEKEAIDIGSYLNSTPKPELPDILKQALSKAEPFEANPVLIEKGRHLFAQKNCVSCHSGVVEEPTTYAKPLNELDFEPFTGCLSERPPGGGVPAYGLDALQKKAIVEALRKINTTKLDSPESQVDWIFSIRNCYSCHERDGKGGPESARELFFTINNPDAAPNGRWETLPPTLSGIGAKLSDQWWKRVLFHEGGSGSVRPFMSARMPIFRKEDMTGLVENIKSLDLSDPAATGEGNAKAGLQSVSRDKHNCVACHGIGDQPPPGIVTVDLNATTDRLLPGYFSKMLQSPHDDIPMPNYKLSENETSDIWAYLSEIEKHPLPEGLLKPNITELKPGEGPIVIRAGLKNISDDAIVVGFPTGTNSAFDLKSCRIVCYWKGRFIDPGKEWESDTPVLLEPLEKVSFLDREKPAEAKFQFYRITQSGLVEIGYTSRGKNVVESLSSETIFQQ